jgi:predicted Zn-dependent protease
VNGNTTKSEDVPLVQNLIMSNTEGSLIDSTTVMEELRCYWNEKAFHYGLVVLVDHENFKFKNDLSDPEPANYGWSHNEGLSLVRRFDVENAVRHEFGHMIGLGSHHPNCAMDWNCILHKFCGKSVLTINELWELR